MKNVSSIKSNATNSPKTPGGISKSLLTPCRRVGLSRNWRNKGPSPFISPLSGSVPEVKEEKIGAKKRKERILDDNIDTSPEASNTIDEMEIKDDHSADIDKTPSRTVETPKRKKSKTLLSAINKSQEAIHTVPVITDENSIIRRSDKTDVQNTKNVEVVSTPVRSKSKYSKKRSPALKRSEEAASREATIISKTNPDACSNENVDTVETPKEPAHTVYKIKEKSPNDLRKECIVVIQRKIFKKTEHSKEEDIDSNIEKGENKKSSSQALFDSDSDDMPLNQLNNIHTKTDTEVIVKHTKGKVEEGTINLDKDDFVDKSTKSNVNKLKETKSPKNKLKTSKSIKTKAEKVKVQPKPSSQSSYDEDDDAFENKKTILIKKTYEKVTKPLKAKSTGSITQKDIDELKARIEAKKKLLLAQSITPETEELRTLIKKWQKGCQEALMELLDLMKSKFHDKQNMDYSEMLKTLKIPPDLVGYDSENDCFHSPDDASIILGQFKDT